MKKSQLKLIPKYSTVKYSNTLAALKRKISLTFPSTLVRLRFRIILEDKFGAAIEVEDVIKDNLVSELR